MDRRIPFPCLLVPLFACGGCDEHTPVPPVGTTVKSVHTTILLTCGDSLDVQFAEPMAQLAEYDLQVASAGQQWRCPFRIGAAVGEVEFTCDPGIHLSVCENAVCGFRLIAAPPTVRVLLRQGDARLLEGEISPRYWIHTPNGPGGLRCQMANVKATWNEGGGRLWQEADAP
jgi:hypothetical protein